MILQIKGIVLQAVILVIVCICDTSFCIDKTANRNNTYTENNNATALCDVPIFNETYVVNNKASVLLDQTFDLINNTTVENSIACNKEDYTNENMHTNKNVTENENKKVSKYDSFISVIDNESKYITAKKYFNLFRFFSCK